VEKVEFISSLLKKIKRNGHIINKEAELKQNRKNLKENIKYFFKKSPFQKICIRPTIASLFSLE
jgi:hypothetical protein